MLALLSPATPWLASLMMPCSACSACSACSPHNNRNAANSQQCTLIPALERTYTELGIRPPSVKSLLDFSEDLMASFKDIHIILDGLDDSKVQENLEGDN